MRSEADVDAFRVDAMEQFGEETPLAEYYTACYEACVPRTFWDVKRADVQYNREPFRKLVCRYCAKRKKALRNGYSLLFLGDNGVGKTMFMSYVLTQMIKRGNTVYYTTLASFDVDLKRGFGSTPHQERLDVMLSSDFVAIDEVGKEYFRADSYLNSRLELLMKHRCDEGEPVIMGTNLDFETLVEMYGSSMASMWEGKYQQVFLETGDFRRTVAAKMRREMGYED